VPKGYKLKRPDPFVCLKIDCVFFNLNFKQSISQQKTAITYFRG
jgi:hypothetical protein